MYIPKPHQNILTIVLSLDQVVVTKYNEIIPIVVQSSAIITRSNNKVLQTSLRNWAGISEIASLLNNGLLIMNDAVMTINLYINGISDLIIWIFCIIFVCNKGQCHTSMLTYIYPFPWVRHFIQFVSF